MRWTGLLQDLGNVMSLGAHGEGKNEPESNGVGFRFSGDWNGQSTKIHFVNVLREENGD